MKRDGEERDKRIREREQKMEEAHKERETRSLKTNRNIQRAGEDTVLSD